VLLATWQGVPESKKGRQLEVVLETKTGGGGAQGGDTGGKEGRVVRKIKSLLRNAKN